MNVISLFSGCGGLDLGFERAGFNIPVSVPDAYCNSCCEQWSHDPDILSAKVFFSRKCEWNACQ